MKKIFTFFLTILISVAVIAQDSLRIQGVNYKVDTIIHKHDVGLGAMSTQYSLPDLPLVVSVLEVDVTNPYVDVMTVLSNDSLRGLEQPTRMATRKSNDQQQVFGGVNADFFIVDGADQGLSVNGQILDGQLAKVPHSSRPVIAFDRTKQGFIDVMSFAGVVSFGGENAAISGVNSSRGEDDLILFNQYQGNSTHTNVYGTEVIVSLPNGEWKVNEPLVCTVEEVQSNMGDADLLPGKAVLSGHGTSAEFLNGLQENDEIELEVNISMSSDPSAAADLLELVGGDRVILNNGNVVDNDWPQLHPRTAAGISKDKTKAFLAVVDGRDSQVSIGVSTKQLADIMKLAGASKAINLDGGGSSTLVVRDEIVNSPSGGYERSVANGLFFASTAPDGEAVDFKLNAESFSIPYGQKETIKASTFNEHNDVVNYLDASGVSYYVEGGIGTVDQNGEFSASGAIGDGVIIGEWNGKKDTVFVTVEPTETLTFAIHNLTIDHLNSYQFDVYGQATDGTYYPMSNDLLSFESTDTSVGEVDEEGVFTGKEDGTVTIRTFIENSELDDECVINVEIGKGHVLLDDFSDPSSWSVLKSFVSDVDLSRDVYPGTNQEMLKVDYTMTYAGRTASIILNKDIEVYGMPDSLLLEAGGSGYENSFILSLDHSQGLCVIPSFSSEDFQEFQTPIKTDMIAQEDYPVPFKSVRITLEKDESYVSGETYEGTLYLNALKAVYPEKGVPSYFNAPKSVNKDFTIFPNPARHDLYVKSGLDFDSRLVFSLVSMSGQLVKKVELDGFVRGSVFPVPLGGVSEGVYLLQISDQYNELLKSEKVVITP